MSKRIVCTICGETVLTFATAEDVDADRLFAVLERELEKHRDVVDSKLPPQEGGGGCFKRKKGRCWPSLACKNN